MRSPPVQDVDILIGTVGVTSKLTTTRVYHLNQIRHTVLDEAHALFDETYEEKLSIFLKRINVSLPLNIYFFLLTFYSNKKQGKYLVWFQAKY